MRAVRERRVTTGYLSFRINKDNAHLTQKALRCCETQVSAIRYFGPLEHRQVFIVRRDGGASRPYSHWYTNAQQPCRIPSILAPLISLYDTRVHLTPLNSSPPFTQHSSRTVC